MLYTLTVRAQNITIIKRVIRKTRKILGLKDRVDDISLVKKYTKGKTFADIGCMWGVNGFYSFLAEENGATKVTAVDVYPESQEFLTEKTKRNSKIQFVNGDINIPETTKKIGLHDTVFCSGVLYHTPDPIHMLMQLRGIVKETLILNTASIPEVPGIKNVSVFYPYLPKEQRKIWDKKVGPQKSITGPYEPEEGYANWFWGMTPSCIESMLQCSGFEITEKIIFPFHSTFVCRAVSTKFIPESGAWTGAKG